MKTHPKEAWNHASMLNNGLQSHRKRTNIMKFKNDSSKTTAIHAVNVNISGEHFTKVFNREKTVN